MTTEIEKSYLAWVGAEHYPTIDSYCAEAAEQGISKRLPSITVAKAIAAPGTVVFMAHDEHQYRPCECCVGVVECPECRKRSNQITRIKTEIKPLLEKLPTVLSAHGAEAAKEAHSIQKKLDNRAVKIKQLRLSCEECECDDGKRNGSTGGAVTFWNGETWDYVKYNYYLHLPRTWKPAHEDGIKHKKYVPSLRRHRAAA